jgi:hypothetical protein
MGGDGVGVPAQPLRDLRIFVVLHRQQAAGELIDRRQARQQPTPARAPSERDEQTHPRTLGPWPCGDETVESPGHDSEPTRPLHPGDIRQTVPMTARNPRTTTAAPSTTAEETAAITAAIERFTQDTSPPPGGGVETLNPWTRASMLEGVTREEHGDVPHPWINP